MSQTYTLTFQGCNCIVNVGGGSGGGGTATPAVPGIPHPDFPSGAHCTAGFVGDMITSQLTCAFNDPEPYLCTSTAAGNVDSEAWISYSRGGEDVCAGVRMLGVTAIECQAPCVPGAGEVQGSEQYLSMRFMGKIGSPRSGFAFGIHPDSSAAAASLYGIVFDWTDNTCKLVRWLNQPLTSYGTTIGSNSVAMPDEGDLIALEVLGDNGVFSSISVYSVPLRCGSTKTIFYTGPAPTGLTLVDAGAAIGSGNIPAIPPYIGVVSVGVTLAQTKGAEDGADLAYWMAFEGLTRKT
jgi:hypothetical protein